MDIDTVMSSYGVDMSSDVGRRNMFLSWTQEHLVAKALGVISDGRTGRPDLMVGLRAVECRIISPRQCGGSTLTASWSQILGAGTMDFVYIVAARDLMSFAFLHIPDVTTADFKARTSPNARAHMMRRAVVDRVRCLHGAVHATPRGFRIVLSPL